MTKHRPGRWPVEKPVDLRDDQGRQHLDATAVRARFHVTLGSVRADLEEQPSPASVRKAAKRWTDAITAMADEVARQIRDTA